MKLINARNGGVAVSSYQGNRNKYGRQTIYINQTENSLLSLSNEKLKKILSQYIPIIVDIHEENRKRIQYLWDYYLGEQDIYEKIKTTRPEINNKKVENWAYAIVDFKKAWQLGNPIQYVMLNETSSDEIEILNKYSRFENKESKDQLIYEDILVTGRGFRYTAPNKITDDDEAPFEILNIDRDSCEVIYSADMTHKQLFSVIINYMEKVILLDGEEQKIYYPQINIYLRNKKLVCDYINEEVIWNKKIDPIILNEHLITEYYVNRDRISLIEIGKDLFDGINQLESLDFDDMEQFVNAIMVFTNAKVDEEGITEIRKLGAVNIKSTENRKASVDLLQNRLNATDTQVFYTRLLTSLHQILGIPMATDNGSVTSGDTGKAKMTGQGYTSAGIRAKTDETMFKMCDFNVLKIILKICKANDKSKIKALKASDIDSKMNRDMSDNLLVKTQGLMNLLTTGVPIDYAIPIVNLFGDSNAVAQAMKKEKEENQKQINNNQITQTQNNKIKQVNELNTQNQ